MSDLSFTVGRDLTICAPVATVWDYLSTDEAWAAWWGAGSSIKAAPGGAMQIVYPNGQTAQGTVQEADPPRRIVFTWGFDRPDAMIPLEGSLVEVTLDAADGGTCLHLVHRVAGEAAADAHRTGWRYQLGLLRSLLSRDVLGRGLAGRIDGWHAAWGIADAAERRRILEEVATADLTVDESMAALGGLDDLGEWIAQSQAHSTAEVRRTGAPAVCADRATWDWEVTAGGTGIATGRSTADLCPDGRFRRITSFWLSAPPGFPTSLVPEGA